MPRWDKNRITPDRVLAVLDHAMTPLTTHEIMATVCARYQLPLRDVQYSRTTLALRTLRAEKKAHVVGVAESPPIGGRPRQLWERTSMLARLR